jgi:hypothetical protein
VRVPALVKGLVMVPATGPAMGQVMGLVMELVLARVLVLARAPVQHMRQKPVYRRG